VQTASARDADDNAASERSTRDGSSGGNRGAAPRADNPAPSYPASARRRGQEGRVILRVVVLPDGDAGEVVLEKSSGVESLDQAALETVRRWRFSPARRNGRPVSATVQVPIRFALK
jgi:protein TonB